LNIIAIHLRISKSFVALDLVFDTGEGGI